MFAALKRLNIYQKEMYPIISRLLLGYLVFGEIYFIILLNHGIIDVRFVDLLYLVFCSGLGSQMILRIMNLIADYLKSGHCLLEE